MPTPTTKHLALGKRLQAARVARNISQQEAADAIGTNRPAISNMERGRRCVDVLELLALARLYVVSYTVLLDRIEDEPKRKARGGGAA